MKLNNRRFFSFPGADFILRLSTRYKLAQILGLFHFLHKLCHVPHFDRIVQSTRCQYTVVPAKLQREYSVSVRAELGHNHRRAQIPDDYCGVGAARAKEATTG